jgi:Fe-S-cluster containining protein
MTSSGDFDVWLKRYARMAKRSRRGERVAAQVPCGTCRACCYVPTIKVEASDDVAHLNAEPDPKNGGLKLRKRADGGCIHLVDGGCSVYQHRPAACRTYDCRMYALIGRSPWWRDASGNVLRAPEWDFTFSRSPARRSYFAALRMAADRYLRGNPGKTLDDALRAAFDGTPRPR